MPKPGKPPKARPEGERSRPPSRRLLLGLAAAFVVAGGAGFLVLKPGDDASSNNRRVPTSGASGILAEVKGSTLTVQTDRETSVKVSTSKSTVVTKTGPGSLADINVGDNVVVTGISTGPVAITAERVVNSGALPGSQGPVGGPGSAGPGIPPGPGGRPSGIDPGIGDGLATGKVQSVAASGFVVSGPDTPPVTVSVGDTTLVLVAKTVAVMDLTVGQPVVVTGASKDDGTVVATSVEQGASEFGPGPLAGRDGMADTTN
ncbi:MAG: hypothetical protein WKF86_06820 [Acidimicrobiales bacterium]